MATLLPPRFVDPASADATNDTLRYNPSSGRVEFMPGGGDSGGVMSGAVTRYALGTTTTINSTTPVDLPDITGNLDATATTDVFLVDVTLDLLGSSTASFVAALLVDGVAQPNQIVVLRGSNERHPARQLFRVTGLSVGAHPFKVQAWLTSANGSYKVQLTHTVVTVTHLTGGGGATTLNDLTDVDTATTPPADDQGLTFDAATGLWVPGQPTPAAHTHPATGITVQDENGNVGTGVTQIDFQGAGVTATSGTGEVVVTIAGGGGILDGGDPTSSNNAIDGGTP